MRNLTRHILLSSLLLIAFQFTAHANSTGFSPWANVPLKARQAVSTWNHQFQPIEMKFFTQEVQSLFTDLNANSPNRSVADFNGDGIKDFAFLGESRNRQHLIVVLSDKKGNAWKVLEAQSWSDVNFKSTPLPDPDSPTLKRGVPVYLTQPAGPASDDFKKENRRDLIQLEAYLGDVQLFGIKNEKIVELEL